MSQSIWTQCGGGSNFRALLAADVFRVVESQSVNSTRKLVDTDAEQALLEELLESVKPKVPDAPAFKGLHYLLFTPFRYPPLRYGSRFGTTFERGIWYGSIELETAFAEVAYYRLLFRAGTAAVLGPLTVELSSFRIGLRARQGVDLRTPAFARFAKRLTSRAQYADCQELGREARADGADALLFTSARAPANGTNVAVFSPTAFASKKPTGLRRWLCTAADTRVEIREHNVLATKPVGYTYLREIFLVGGKLPAAS